MREKWTLAVKKFLYYYFSLFHIREKKAIEAVSDITNLEEELFVDSKIHVGIVKEKWHLHSSYIKACRELQISYTVIDFFSKNWLEQLKNKPVDILVARPSVQYTPWKDMFDNRLKLLKEHTDIPIFPNANALWLWENKLRTLDFLKVNNLPYPNSYIFYDKTELHQFAEVCNYPIVYKASSGSGATGVKILKNSSQLRRVVKKVFDKGTRSYRKHRLDKEHGYLILQDYLANVGEWRIVRIGDYYFGFEKLKDGEFHSGSKYFGYGMPPEKCLELVRNLTDTYDFKFVSVDVFYTEDKQYLINEIQPYFGQKDDRELLQIDGVSGRLRYNPNNTTWVFEKGSFCKNNMSNLRLLELVKTVKP